jgi:hypothetical protein
MIHSINPLVKAKCKLHAIALDLAFAGTYILRRPAKSANSTAAASQTGRFGRLDKKISRRGLGAGFARNPKQNISRRGR